MALSLEVIAILAPFLALLLTWSPGAITAIQQWYRQLVSFFWPAKCRCSRMLWTDIPDGRVINHLSALVDPSSAIYKAKKPYQLPLGQTFMQTDSQTLIAYIILTADLCPYRERKDAESLLEIKNFGSIVTVSLKAPAAGFPITPLSKFEMEKLIQGYTPFYRSTVTTTGNITINHPIRNSEDMRKGAWILAVGLTLSNGPVPLLHNMQRMGEVQVDAYWKGTVVLRAFEAIKGTLQKLKIDEIMHRESTHPRSREPCPCKRLWAGHGLACYDLIMSPEYSLLDWNTKAGQIENTELFKLFVGECPCSHRCLGTESHSPTCRRSQHTKNDPASQLTKAQCVAALEIFSNNYHLPENLDIIWPVFAEILQSVMLGLSEVEHYFSQQSQKLVFPAALKESKRIYIRYETNDDE